MNTKQSKTISLEDVLDLYKQALEEVALVVITDAEGKITYANAGWCALTGYEPEEMVSGDYPLAEEGPQARSFKQRLWKTLGSGTIWRGTIATRKKDGSHLLLKTTIFPFPAAPREPFQFLAVAGQAPSLPDSSLDHILNRGLVSQDDGFPEEPTVDAGTDEKEAAESREISPGNSPEAAPAPVKKEVLVLLAAEPGINRMIIGKLLEKLHIAFKTAGDGLAVLNKLQQEVFDLIVMDMKMPILEGTSTLKAIRRNKETAFHNIPVIALSTSQQSSSIEKCLAAGADDCLAEPFSMEELESKIHHLITGKQKSPHMENQEKSASATPLYDLEYLEQLSEGDQEFTSSMIQYFIENAPGVLDSMNQHYQQEEWEELRNVAHKFKPQLNFMGISSVLEEVENIEQDAFRKQNLERIPDNIRKTDHIVRAAIEQLKTKLEDFS